MTYKVEELHWLIAGIRYFVYDEEKVIKYCEDNCGYEFVPKIPGNTSQDFDDMLFKVCKENKDLKSQDFNKWLSNYLRSINSEEACNFMYSHLNASVDMDDDVNYVVEIPQAIIDMSNDRGG